MSDNDPPDSGPTWRAPARKGLPFRIAFATVAAACIAASVWHAHTIAYAPDGLPTWDPAGYLLEAVKIHASVVSWDVWGVIKGLTKPDLHPPLHSGMLAAWLTLAGNTMASARLYPVVCFVASLGLLVWMGHRALPADRRGLEVGLIAALLTALGSGNLELLSSPMTESTGLLTQLLALGLAVHWADRRDARAQLGIGVAVLAATLVRFNMAPMLLAPLYAHHAWRFGGPGRRDRNALLDPRVLLWAAPTLVGFALWQLSRPELYGYVQKFFENRSSGLAFWSAESLLFVPLSVHRSYVPWLGVALFVPFLIGLAPRVWKAHERAEADHPDSGAGLGRLQAYVLISFAALTWHDFKIARNLATVLPVFYLCAIAPFATLRFARAQLPGFASMLALGCGYGAWQHTVTLDGLAARTDFQPDPIAFEALQFIEKHARRRDQAWVTGWVFRISPNLIDYWLRVNGVTAKLRLDQQLFGTQSRTGVEAPWTEEYTAWTADTVLAPEHRDRTTYITIETVPGTRYFDQWKAFGNHYARAFEEQPFVPEVDRLELVDAGLTVRVYRTHDTPSAATIAARDTGPTAEDNEGIALPAGVPPISRETFHARARRWMVYPPGALGDVQVTREGSALEVRVDAPQKALQVCNTVREAPAARFTAIVNASTDKLSGKAFLHFRGMGADDQLQKLPGGAYDITHAGPLLAGPNLLQKAVVLGPDSPKLRVCLMLDGLTGTVRLEDIALYAEGAVLSLRVPSTGAAVGLPVAGTGPFAPGAWRLYPRDADAVLRTVGNSLEVQVNTARPQLQACGPTVPWVPPMYASVHARSSVTEGKAFVHLRALDADAVLLQGPEGRAHIEHIGPIAGSAAKVEETRALPFPDNTALVRPCLVLDGVVGTVTVDMVGITEGTAPAL